MVFYNFVDKSYFFVFYIETWRFYSLQLGLGRLWLHDRTHVQLLFADQGVSVGHAGLQPVATIDNQDLARDVRGRLRGQVQCRVLDIADLAHAADGDADGLALGGQLGHTDSVGDGAGGNAVGADAEGAPLVGPDQGQGVDTGLGGTGVGLEDLAVVREGGRDVDDRALGGLEVGEGALCGVEGSNEI